MDETCFVTALVMNSVNCFKVEFAVREMTIGALGSAVTKVFVVPAEGIWARVMAVARRIAAAIDRAKIVFISRTSMRRRTVHLGQVRVSEFCPVRSREKQGLRLDTHDRYGPRAVLGSPRSCPQEGVKSNIPVDAFGGAAGRGRLAAWWRCQDAPTLSKTFIFLLTRTPLLCRDSRIPRPMG